MLRCNQCPNLCDIDRTKFCGKCRSGSEMKVARSALHFWEEPILSGTGGSGTIFFSGCNAKCVFCQNYQISAENFGKEVTIPEFIGIVKNLEKDGANNINLVNPTHFRDKIIEAFSIYKPSVPIVYNSNGYETEESIELLAPYIDIFLPDFKYSIDDLAVKYSGLANYKNIAVQCIKKMIEVKGNTLYNEDGTLLKSGVIIRHLVIPNNLENSKKVIDTLADNFDKNTFLFSLMLQYTPCYMAENFSELNRKLKPLEGKIITNYLLNKGFTEGFVQELSSASIDYIPSFDLTGVE